MSISFSPNKHTRAYYFLQCYSWPYLLLITLIMLLSIMVSFSCWRCYWTAQAAHDINIASRCVDEKLAMLDQSLQTLQNSSLAQLKIIGSGQRSTTAAPFNSAAKLICSLQSFGIQLKAIDEHITDDQLLVIQILGNTSFEQLYHFFSYLIQTSCCTCTQLSLTSAQKENRLSFKANFIIRQD